MEQKKKRMPFRKDIMKVTNGKCFYCGMDLCIEKGYLNSMSPDHMVPRCKGGGNEIENIVPSCLSCNHKKGGKTVDEFRSTVSRKERMPDLKIMLSEIQIAWLRKEGFDLGIKEELFYGETI